MSNQPNPFFTSDVCRSRMFCEPCRNRAGFRASLLKSGLSAESEFDCPHGFTPANLPPKPSLPIVNTYPCHYRGERIIGGDVLCSSCGDKKTRVFVFECALAEHPRCHLFGKDVPGVHACRGCEERVESAS